MSKIMLVVVKCPTTSLSRLAVVEDKEHLTPLSLVRRVLQPPFSMLFRFAPSVMRLSVVFRNIPRLINCFLAMKRSMRQWRDPLRTYVDHYLLELSRRGQLPSLFMRFETQHVGSLRKIRLSLHAAKAGTFGRRLQQADLPLTVKTGA